MNFKHLYISLIGIFFLSSCVSSPEEQEPKEIITEENILDVGNSEPEKDILAQKKIQLYSERYGAENPLQKIVDNTGDGHEELYGLRNVRPVLKGIVYRGGGNNYYHRSQKRGNENPLPEDGLQNLCEEGFSQSIYLYRRNFFTASSKKNCTDFNEEETTLDYLQKDYNSGEDIREIIEIVYKNIVQKYEGPIYIHCWNGWHASGYVSAVLLKQFCGYTSEEAVEYWDLATDGVNKAPGYEEIREQIRFFEPYPEYKISEEWQEKVCL